MILVLLWLAQIPLAYTLEAEAERLNGHADERVGQALRHGAATTRAGARALRTLLVDIYPAGLHQAGLSAALDELGRMYTARGIETSVDAPNDLAIDDATERLLFRAAQEALRNVHKHAGARTARIAVRHAGEWIRLEVHDDGCGCDAESLLGRMQEGHLGLRLLHDLVADAGGRIEIRPGPHGGTIVGVELAPRRAARPLPA